MDEPSIEKNINKLTTVVEECHERFDTNKKGLRRLA
jgi:hypothetical protein